ncbi:MAG: hypothetical protein HY741_17155 [Chloroflexi bacterium]|nr:hypothetical protein [Chloroflexota bacterium]
MAVRVSEKLLQKWKSYNAHLGVTHYGGASQLHAAWLQEDMTPDGFSVYHLTYAGGQAAAGTWTGPIELYQDGATLQITSAAAAGNAPLVGVAYIPLACDDTGNNCAPLRYRECSVAATNGDCANDAQWSAPEQVAQDTNAPALAFDADGNAHLAWRAIADAGYAIAYAAKLQGGGWTGAVNVFFGLGGDVPGTPAIGAGSAADVYIGFDDWTQAPPQLQLSHFDGSGWTTALQSSDASGMTERWGSVIVDASGVGQFVWSGGNGQVYYAGFGTANPTPTATATLTPTATATPTNTPTPVPPGVEQMNVYVVAYTGANPNLREDNRLAALNLTNRLMETLTDGTRYHGYQNPASQPYLGWIPYRTNTGDVLHVINGDTPVHCLTNLALPLDRVRAECVDSNPNAPGNADIKAVYNAIFADVANGARNNSPNDLCQLINAGEIQEIWIWADTLSGVAEWISIGPPDGYTGPEGLLGPDYYDMPTCGAQRQSTVMGLNFQNSDLANAAESYHHHLEHAFNKLFPCSFPEPATISNGSAPFWPIHQKILFDTVIDTWDSSYYKSWCSGYRGFMVRSNQGTGDTDTSQCGWSHFPPNVSWWDEEREWKGIEYDGVYRRDLNFKMGCDDWRPYLTGSQNNSDVAINCNDGRAWGCDPNDQRGSKVNFHRWWMQNIPGEGNQINHCSYGGLDSGMPIGNWWNYLRGDVVNMYEVKNGWWCNPISISPQYIGFVSAGRVSGATIKLYEMQVGGVIFPISNVQPVQTDASGVYVLPSLPEELEGKTLVVESTGGTFVDEATGQVISLDTHALYSVIPAFERIRLWRGVVTPFTDLAFRIARYRLEHDPNLAPSEAAASSNVRIAVLFDFMEEDGHRTDIIGNVPIDLYQQGQYTSNSEGADYALRLAGLSQQALDRGTAPVSWLSQLAADADDDGILNSAGLDSVQTLQTAIAEYLAGERNPFNTPTPSPTQTDTAVPSETPTPTLTSTDTPTDTPTITPTDTATPTPMHTITPTFTPTDTPTATVTYPPTPTPTAPNTATMTPTVVPSKTKVKGEGKIPSTVSGKKASFKVETKRKKAGGPLKGEIEYEDKAAGIKFKSTTLDDLVVTENHAVIQGTGILNKTTTIRFTVTIQDNGEPGRDTDTFAISFSNGYGNDGTLTEGNIQVREDERDE